MTAFDLVSNLAVKYVVEDGGCAEIGDDRICLLDSGHAGPHGWEARPLEWPALGWDGAVRLDCGHLRELIMTELMAGPPQLVCYQCDGAIRYVTRFAEWSDR